jgi:uncharacterized protein
MQESLRESLHLILNVQELDMKMIRLMRVKRERLKEIEQIESLRKELHEQLSEKGKEITELNKSVHSLEQKVQEINAKLKKLETQQSSVKKVEEFNALTQEMTSAERERTQLEQKVLPELVDRRTAQEELLEKIKESLKTSEESSIVLEREIQNSIKLINQEGLELKRQRDALASEADSELLKIYERLLRNKRDRVIVPIENRTCSGCHISLTAQHENLVRKGSNLVFCEHCSRIHYWQEGEALEGATVTTKRRRRRAVNT